MKKFLFCLRTIGNKHFLPAVIIGNTEAFISGDKPSMDEINGIKKQYIELLNSKGIQCTVDDAAITFFGEIL